MRYRNQTVPDEKLGAGTDIRITVAGSGVPVEGRAENAMIVINAVRAFSRDGIVIHQGTELPPGFHEAQCERVDGQIIETGAGGHKAGILDAERTAATAAKKPGTRPAGIGTIFRREGIGICRGECPMVKLALKTVKLQILFITEIMGLAAGVPMRLQEA